MSMTVLILVLCVSLSGLVSQTAPKPSPREKVETAIAEGTRLLESKDYTTFLLQFVPPDQVKKLGGSPEALDAWVEHFAAQAPAVLAALKDASTQSPTYDDTYTIATFPLKAESGPKTLRMVKIGRYWYVGNP
jgi:hypothetical protein